MNKLKVSFKYSAVLLLVAFGRFPLSWLLSKKRGKSLKWKAPADNCWVECASGNEFYVEFEGPVDAQLLVFVHGLNANRKQWYYQRDYFNKIYRCVFIDLPGHGRSFAAKDLSMPTLAADLKGVLEVLEINQPIIYGHSWGSSILMQYCIHSATGINAKGIILHGGSYNNPLKNIQSPITMQALEKPIIVPLLKFIKKVSIVFDLLSWTNFSSGLSCLITRFYFFTGTQTAAQLRYTARFAPDNSTRAVSAALLQLFQLELTAAQLSNIKVPVLIVGSIYDRINLLKCSLFIYRKIPGSQLLLVKAGHQSLVEKHDELNKAVKNFIQGLTTF